MSKSACKRPVIPKDADVGSKQQHQQQQQHWCQHVYEVEVAEGICYLNIEGGSDNGEFAYFGTFDGDKVKYGRGKVAKDDVILEIQGQKVAGYTQRDVVAWLNHCCRNGNPIIIRAVRSGCLTKDLRQYLNTRFQKGSIDHDLQNTIRDNLYLRTVPCTTRPQRDGEVNGVDYTFLTPEEFIALERSGNLLESGIYEGNMYGTPRPAPAASAFSANLSNVSIHPVTCNHYGTPKPHKETPTTPPRRTNSIGNSSGIILPGAHPSSEGKRRRNRSNVEAMAAKSVDPTDSSDCSLLGQQPNTRSSTPLSAWSARRNSGNLNKNEDVSPLSNLGPLPDNWEKAYTPNGEVYFIDHNSGTSQWLDPRMARIQKKAIEECDDDELPFGWERIDDPHYGTYYIDHVNRKTQYENPVLQAKRLTHDISGSDIHMHSNTSSWQQQSDWNQPDQTESPQANRNNTANTNSKGQLETDQTNNPSHRTPYVFTRNPSELKGEFIQTSLVKSPRGLGFTIVGGDSGEVEEFLQIKSVVPNGPAWSNKKLQTGDVLVYVNDICVLGYTHQNMVSLFQSIPPGETVNLQVCRGYPLPFDPNDPNTEIVTTVAVTMANARTSEFSSVFSSGNNSHGGNIGTDPVDSVARSAKSMPDLSSGLNDHSHPQRHNSADLLSNSNAENTPDILDFSSQSPNKPEYLTVEIVKGASGFGFTIADSAYGQKVKKILDRPRCKLLQEGDILMDINGQEVRGLPHADVVQVLKDCPCGDGAHITVQRGGLLSPVRGKGRLAKMKSSDGSNKGNGSVSQSLLFPNLSRSFEDGLTSSQVKHWFCI
ncbi:membrane-associated guanylate kinase, WW and PDZ domain-containing protein 2-like isoform X3 [Centruroides sculpturatus]|uniref:membrane-associated guanylate kinase, WW and PDZ domain-containing protein 2-like isoform X3 n=1 Tax=Centruroides sculpturatus TaxID=218467 RepID=UPI000C6DADAA|nr:membrane-associated guanylate kinase, WW and PDZ domain-containing protein 2-like isoform X3 [Centruroides sculpturatus]